MLPSWPPCPRRRRAPWTATSPSGRIWADGWRNLPARSWCVSAFSARRDTRPRVSAPTGGRDVEGAVPYKEQKAWAKWRHIPNSPGNPHRWQSACGTAIAVPYKAFRVQKNPPVLLNRGIACLMGEELLLQGLLNSNGHGDGHTDHGVVACAQEASQAPLAVRKTPEIM